jgi:hypothetical protein
MTQKQTTTMARMKMTAHNNQPVHARGGRKTMAMMRTTMEGALKNHWRQGRMVATTATLIEVEVTGTVVLGKKDDCNTEEEEKKISESKYTSNEQSYSINNNNKYSNQP